MKHIDIAKLKRIVLHSLKSIWILSRIKLLLLLLQIASFWFLFQPFIDYVNSANYAPAVVVSFFLGMVAMKCLDTVISIGSILYERIKWLIENRNLVYITSQND